MTTKTGRMTAYQALLLDFTPRPIRTEAAYRKALRQIDKLMKPSNSRAESELLELLSTLVEQYESQEHPTPKASQRDLLAHLLDAKGASKAEAARASDVPRSVITNVLAGRRRLSQANIVKLAAYFNVSSAEFLEPVE